MLKSKLLVLLSLFLSIGFSMQGNACEKHAKDVGYNLPTTKDYPGYEIVDGVGHDTTKLTVSKNKKIAIVVKDIATTAYSYLPPQYENSMVNFEGVSRCCTKKGLMGNSGMAVYKFSFHGKGTTTIKIVARHKGLSQTATHYDDDQIKSEVTVEVK